MYVIENINGFEHARDVERVHSTECVDDVEHSRQTKHELVGSEDDADRISHLELLIGIENFEG